MPKKKSSEHQPHYGQSPGAKALEKERMAMRLTTRYKHPRKNKAALLVLKECTVTVTEIDENGKQTVLYDMKHHWVFCVYAYCQWKRMLAHKGYEEVASTSNEEELRQKKKKALNSE